MSGSEIIVKSGKIAGTGDAEWEVRDSQAQVIFTDFISENRVKNGVVYLSLGSVVTDLQNPPVVEITTRLRMDIVTAQIIRDTLSNLIETATAPVDQSKAN